MNKRPLEPKDFYRFKSFGDARVSPSGKDVAFVRQRHDLEKEKSFTDIFLHNVESGSTRQLTNSGKDRSPRWSPDGTRLAFVSDRTEKPQVWVIDPKGGEAWRVPTSQSVQGDVLWSPRGDKVLFASNAFCKADDWEPYPGAPADDRKRAVEQAERALKPKDDKPKGDKPKTKEQKPNDIKVITRFSYRRDGVGYFGDLRRQVYRVDVPSAPRSEKEESATPVTSGDYDHSMPCLSPEGEYMVVSALRQDDADLHVKSDLWLFEVESGKASLLYDAPGPCNSPQISPDGQFLAFLGHDMGRNVSTRADLYILPVGSFAKAALDGEAPPPLTLEDATNVTAHLDSALGWGSFPEPFFGGMSGLVWQGAAVHFLLQRHGETFVYKAEFEEGVWCVEKVMGQEGRGLGGFHLEKGVLAYQSCTSNAPDDIFVWQDGIETRVTSENDEMLAELALGTVEKFAYRSKDGQELDGWVVYPYGYEPGKKYPLVLDVHGGPHSAYTAAFRFSTHLFASRGYAVVYCNPRGSSFYGQEFMAVIDGDWGNKDYEDVMGCVDEMVSRGIADGDNLFIHGWSYGGYMTAWVVTQTSRFRAACAGACVSNLHSGYGTEDITLSDEHEYGGTPWNDAAGLLQRSPLSHVHKVTTPVLLLHGESDLRCPLSHAEQFYTGLMRLGKAAVFVAYPGEFHSFKRHLYRIDRFGRMLAWFEHHKKKE